MIQGLNSIKSQRIHKIVTFVTQRGSVSVEDLAHLLDVSSMTIYRDIALLESTGLIQRSRGKIVSSPVTVAETSPLMRMSAQVDAKRRIAQAALSLLSPGVSVAVDDSTTCLHLFPDIGVHVPLTVMTNARFIADKVVGCHDLDLIQLGGNYVKWADAYYGPQTEKQALDLHPDFCLMSTTAINGGMCTHPDVSTASLKGIIMRSAHTRILLADHTKFSRSALHSFFSLAEVDIVITDEVIDDKSRSMLEKVVKQVIIV